MYKMCWVILFVLVLPLSKVTPKLLKITYQRVLKLSLSTSAITQRTTAVPMHILYSTLPYILQIIYKSSWKVFALCFLVPTS